MPSGIVDTTFDFRTDAGGKDPDCASPTLRRFHRFLWSKPLPDERFFELDGASPHGYLLHDSDIGKFMLTSDSVIATFTRYKSMRHITECFPLEENESFQSVGYTMGGMMIFPGNRVERKPTLNGARGLSRTISDRMDLTLECIRRHYLGQDNPLGPTLRRYADFFAIFSHFRGYVEFFLLQDLVAEDFSEIRFFLPFEDFNRRGAPADVEAYRSYRRASIEFVTARNKRIDLWTSQNPPRESPACR
jgi:hypothetical protein